MTSAPIEDQPQKSKNIDIFDSHHLRYYAITLLSMVSIVFCHLLFVPSTTFPIQPGPGGFGPPREASQLLQSSWDAIWPLWGQLAAPTIGGLIVILISGVVLTTVLYRLRDKGMHVIGSIGIAAIGIFLAILTNLTHGYNIGIWAPVGGTTEILVDASQISNPLSFLSDYALLQPSLSVHAQTQPPGAVLTLYVLNLFLNDAGLISIAICVISFSLSAFFISRIYRRFFGLETSRYATFLFVLLPAIQVYFLANIYAIVCVMFLAFLYFYFHENNKAAYIGSAISLIMGTFISFLFVFAILFMVSYELLAARSTSRKQSESFLYSLAGNLTMPVLLIGVVGLFYVALHVLLGFSYIDAFLYASSLENPDGFMLLTNPGNYLITRIQNVLDIAFFFGPLLIVLGIQGVHQLKEVKEHDPKSNRMYLILVAALLALSLMFLAGAPKKGETARICMFILPVLLMPVISYLESIESGWKQNLMLLGLVFLQTVIMQTLFIFVW